MASSIRPVANRRKVPRHEALYQRERDVYLRLENLALRRLGGFEIPRLTVCDDHLLIIEMTIVQPPFARHGIYLTDVKPDTSSLKTIRRDQREHITRSLAWLPSIIVSSRTPHRSSIFPFDFPHHVERR